MQKVFFMSVLAFALPTLVSVNRNYASTWKKLGTAKHLMFP